MATERVKPSEEKAWLSTFRPEDAEFRFSQESLYESICHTRDNNGVAFRYFGMPFSYVRFHDMIDRAARAFASRGIVKGDTVMMMLPTLPETLVSFYALNRLGAVVDFIDVRFTPERVLEIARRVRPKMLLVMTFYLKKLETVRADLPVDRILLLRGCDSMPKSVLFWYRLGEHFNGRRRLTRRSKKYLFWSDFMSEGPDRSAQNCDGSQEFHGGALKADVNAHDTACIFQTSGTSGFPKSMCHSNFNMVNSAISKYRYLNDPKPGDRLLSMLPPFSMFGFVFNIHMPLMFGMTLEIVPLFVPEKMSEILAKRRPNHILCVPSQWNSVAATPARNHDLSFLKTVFVAGESVDRTLRNRVNAFFAANGSRAVLQTDYGMTEAGGTIAFTTYEKACENELSKGYSGYPAPWTEVCIYDNEKQCELDYGEVGEICAIPPFGIREYLNDADATGELMKRHADGKAWVHTGDIGYLAEDGSLHLEGRRKRMIVRFDGTKIFPIEIETAIKGVKGVSDCTVVPITDTEHDHSQLPCAFVVAESGAGKDLERDIMNLCSRELPVYLQPAEIRFVDRIPHNSAGKADFRQLMEQLKAQ